ncbi:MAG: hypothetical protein Q8M20_11125 [Rhodocyclaceae bacterium]|nr:hypothetical protein [Rhodocyclaceae bacterium]
MAEEFCRQNWVALSIFSASVILEAGREAAPILAITTDRLLAESMKSAGFHIAVIRQEFCDAGE